jgi:hypothetical protein
MGMTQSDLDYLKTADTELLQYDFHNLMAVGSQDTDWCREIAREILSRIEGR